TVGKALMLGLCAATLASPSAAQPKKQVAVKTLNGLALVVTDVARSVEVYESVFGMRNYAPRGAPPVLEIGAGPSFVTMRQGPSPRLDYIQLGVEGFKAEDVMKTLLAHGVTRSTTPSPAPMTAWIVKRGETSELFLNDPNGLRIQLQDVSYCGGSGPLGDKCPRPMRIRPGNSAT